MNGTDDANESATVQTRRSSGRFSRLDRHLRIIGDTLPRVGHAGSRSAYLHQGDDKAVVADINYRELRRYRWLQWLGCVGAILIMFGGIGAGAVPVVGNAFWVTTTGGALGRMLVSTTVVTFVGIGLLVLAWLGVGAFMLAAAKTRRTVVSTGLMARTLATWVLPLSVTAPLFTQDIYSYLAQGSITRRGLDPYSAGPVDLLGADAALARSVPLIWSHSPSPYGPTAMQVGAWISALTDDHIVLGVFLHRAVAIISLFVVAWALVNLARRLGVSPQFALWLGVLNPLTLLHLVGGIHNEALLLAFLLSGFELCLRALDQDKEDPTQASKLSAKQWALFIAGATLICFAGMVKVTGFVALGFVGMWLARRYGQGFFAVFRAGIILSAIAVIVCAAVSLATGVGFGWISSQGGAASLRSWMSLSTNLGTLAGVLGSWLGLGDVSEEALTFTRGIFVALAGAWMLRMLLATFRGRIHPVGGYGLSMFVLVLFFPVVHPWYLLWAIVPLSAWANARPFRIAVVTYSAVVSFFVLPRGLGLPPATVLQIYSEALMGFVAVVAVILLVSWRTKVFRLR